MTKPANPAPPRNALWRPSFERDACGFGLMARLDGQSRHALVDSALAALARMTHRGAIAADGRTGDGCGLLVARPDAFLEAVADESGIRLDAPFAAGNVFLDPDPDVAAQERTALAGAIEETGLQAAGWREVPVDASVCGDQAERLRPRIEQLFVNAPGDLAVDDFRRRLLVARRAAERALEGHAAFHVVSLSPDVIGYKGLVMPAALPAFYPDLRDARFASGICVFHQRFSTNTWPHWKLAQPFRHLAHNGEINTIAGNRRWARARLKGLQSPNGFDFDAIAPIVDFDESDSASLDRMLEAMMAGGLDVFHAMRMLMPPAWQNVDAVDPDMRAFYEFWSLNMDPWDGPAGIVLTDGRFAVCSLDRNGLRPARWVQDDDGVITLASEAGVVDVEPGRVVARGRLGPGDMLGVDTQAGEILMPDVIGDRLKQGAPYKHWLRAGVRRLGRAAPLSGEAPDPACLSQQQRLFGISLEQREQILRPLAEDGAEAIGSMGDDTPMWVLSRRVRPLYDAFRQQFAQVTNPPIDPIREQVMMSLESCLGPEANPFDVGPDDAHRLVLDSPVLSTRKFNELRSLDRDGWTQREIALTRAIDEDLSAALDRLCATCDRAVREGTLILVLSDRDATAERIPVHALLAVGAIHHHLAESGLRCRTNLVVDTATALDPHHVACLIGFGATAVHAWLAYEIVLDLHRGGRLEGDVEAKTRLGNWRRGINKGLYKILSKMGISTIRSYRGAQLFEIVGLADEVVQRCFPGAVSRIGGAGFDDLAADQAALAAAAADSDRPLEPGGVLRWIHGSEYHDWHPEAVNTLQEAVRGDREAYRRFAATIDQRPVAMLRDLLRPVEADTPLDPDRVEDARAITPRFECAGMSLGALSPEAHEAIAVAMNGIGGRSNSGEGGEDPARTGTERASKIRQVASGRFGVTAQYLAAAEVIQIKMAQGAKPGEGGQLPGHKVDGPIAKLRFAVPGVGLISPPPHHDIYSIEDLAQLIFDLKEVNPRALVSVKLVAAPGVGTVAAGVAKAYADLITISGYDGGTGASPLTSVLYAGSPWELGLSEAHQTLRANGLRDRVRLQADGGLKTGRDVIKAALLGAESFGFGTAPLVALGCKYLRICHLNNCATGVATQNQILRRQYFRGEAEMVRFYFECVAEDVREWLGRLGFERLEDIVGRTDLLERLPGDTRRQRALDLSPILSDGGVAADVPRTCRVEHNVPFDRGELASRIAGDTDTAVRDRLGGEFAYTVRNHDRSIGARLSGRIAELHGDQGMADAPLTLRLDGTAGQSLGAWNAGGLDIVLTGEANDYVGKGMTGGRIVIRPDPDSTLATPDTPVMGNTCLYGATGGHLYAAGTAGQRFAVRNSGAVAVVEGCGDHGCEYMTGGAVVVLGRTGLNFGAGMTGGLAYVLDMEREFVDRHNRELIEIHRMTAERREEYVHHLVELLDAHIDATGSAYAAGIREDLSDYLPRFWLVTPKAADLSKMLQAARAAA
ncbi:MAG: glutamate synthase large subunit [Halofilum sp. (in: g-proteobacteria)]|nr:glutamate synthase large subunit [Halofilum sp. (in: g-proteobacteria)]